MCIFFLTVMLSQFNRAGCQILLVACLFLVRRSHKQIPNSSVFQGDAAAGTGAPEDNRGEQEKAGGDGHEEGTDGGLDGTATAQDGTQVRLQLYSGLFHSSVKNVRFCSFGLLHWLLPV